MMKYKTGNTQRIHISQRAYRADAEGGTLETDKTHTDPIVPNTGRGLEDNHFASIEDLLTSLPPDSSDITSGATASMGQS